MKKLMYPLVFLTLTLSCYSQTKTNMKKFDPHFAHTVYFWLKNPDSPDDQKAFETSLQKFLDNSAYAKTNFIGKPPKASREVVDGSFTYSLIVTFESAEAQQNYQDEAPHKLFIEESSNLWEKVIVYDSKGI
ncbi:Dabb family protein [Ulvibacterium sp.]|uniref:Dabb family protein n=1 Tax=Ulvibacterium sp. TaxID=2665914 RepID=UPI002625279C|nr:Dabb family protein [Ulvibacterium sp.]